VRIWNYHSDVGCGCDHTFGHRFQVRGREKRPPIQDTSGGS
jgi:hypothetical protein